MVNPSDQVFVNCPFDEAYKPLFDAIVFAITDLGFYARSAREEHGKKMMPASSVSQRLNALSKNASTAFMISPHVQHAVGAWIVSWL